MKLRSAGVALLFLPLFLIAPLTSRADASDIQSQIDAINAQKAALDAEITKDQAQLDSLGAQHQTLQSSITTLNVSQSQLASKIQSTQKSIDAANLQLEQLGAQIGTAEESIDTDQQVVAQSIRDIQSTDDYSLIEQIFSAGTLSDAWTAIDADQQLALSLQNHTQDLSAAKDTLTTHQQAVASKKSQLASLGTDLSTQNKQLTVSKQAKQTLLAQTQNQESAYQTLIATKQAQEAAFESALSALQSQLAPVGAGSIPAIGAGILSWPFSASVMSTCPAKASVLGNPDCITQYFGNTAFAIAHASVYSGQGHDGIDIGVPIGTPVEAALSGIVIGTGNTDLIYSSTGAQCLSFGKWVMIQHADGLDTLYGHLSLIEVTKGQAVTTGQEIGLSGMTGYATGPHLHFGVYASSGVQIMDLGKFKGTGGTPCTDGGAVIPVAPTNAYLNPLSYL